jgi:hypothetical protein
LKNFYGKIVDFNPITNKVTFDLCFLDEDIIESLDEGYKSQKVLKVNFTERFKQLKTYPQIQRVHAMMKAIMLHQGETPSKEGFKSIKSFLEESVFPTRPINTHFLSKCLEGSTLKNDNLKDEEIITLSEQTIDELSKVMQKIEDSWPEIFKSGKDWYEVD